MVGKAGLHLRRRDESYKSQTRQAHIAIPRHPAVEIKTGTFRAILKQLGLKE
ncbi:MAG: type II toxin-antitoxin system HicA family toxin [Candidatus Solibacter sp.]